MTLQVGGLGRRFGDFRVFGCDCGFWWLSGVLGLYVAVSWVVSFRVGLV